MEIYFVNCRCIIIKLQIFIFTSVIKKESREQKLFRVPKYVYKLEVSCKHMGNP